jgi:hypothetical protein
MSGQRFRPTDAFVDESIRGQRYLMGCVLTDVRTMNDIRIELKQLVTRHNWLHFHNESNGQRRRILSVFAELPILAFGVMAMKRPGVTEPMARHLCVARIVGELQQRKVPRLVIESRQDDRDDAHSISRARKSNPRLVFEHRMGADEPLLWLADGITWALGAGPQWAAAIEPILLSFDEIQP